MVVGLWLEHARRIYLVEFLGKDDLAVELVDRFRPGVRTEGVVVDAQTTPTFTLTHARTHDVAAAHSRRQERKDGLPNGRGLWSAMRRRARLRAAEPRIELVLPCPEHAFPDDAADVGVINGIPEEYFDLWEGKRLGIVPGERAEALGDEARVP